MEILYYVVSEEDFFVTPCSIDCEVNRYCAFPNANMVLDVDRVYEKRLINVGEGIMISEPVILDIGLLGGGLAFFVSLSHNGILAISSFLRRQVIQLTDLLSDRRVDLRIENPTSVAFYDNRIILLTRRMPLEEANVDDVFRTPNVSTFNYIGDVQDVNPFTDTSLLHSRRLYYTSMRSSLYEYNVDTRINREIKVESKVRSLISMLGVDCGVRAVFEDFRRFTYTLDAEDNTSLLYEPEYGYFSSLFVSSDHQDDLRKSALLYSEYLVKGRNKIEVSRPIEFGTIYAVARVYRDIFLLHDMETTEWVLCRVIVS